jgi:MoaA/NifB/PqqE/SkfB family radical SAM enzyme
MSWPCLDALPGVAVLTPNMLKLSPFLHLDGDRVYDPLTDRTLVPGDAAYERIREFQSTGAADPALESDGWLIDDEAELSHAYRLKIVSLETLTTCNQKCYFCPVSIAPREDEAMPDRLFERIVGELTAFRPTLEAVFLQSYNEPTLDKRFLEHCRTLFAAGLPVAVLSNGTGLVPAKVDALIEAGPLRYICINLSTLDRERYLADRGADHLPVVLRNLDYVKDRPLAQQMKIAVLGTGDENHARDFEAICERFGSSRFEIEQHLVMDRAGWLEVGMKAADRERPLAGCDNVGSRPLQHLHINPSGRCVLCCEDYDEKYLIGDLNSSTIAEVLAGEEIAKLRRWVYGVEEAPSDFMCRDCIYARRG